MKKLPTMLLLLLLPTILLSAFIGQAKATNAFYAWGALEYYLTPYAEYCLESEICSLVTSWMPSGWITENNYETNTNSANLYSKIAYTQSNGIRTCTLWVGDFCPGFNYGNLHWTFYSGGSGRPNDRSWDSMIYYYAHANNKQWSQFIWTCSCGGIYFNDTVPHVPNFPTTSTNNNNHYGWYDQAHDCAIGMPYAWTGNYAMSLNGYSNPDSGRNCFIGWENASPYLMDVAPNSGFLNYWFLYNYYSFALGRIDGQYHSIHDSLDYASYCNFYQTFGNCPYTYGWLKLGYWTRMRVFGNSINP